MRNFLKRIYKKLPLKKTAFSIVKAFVTPHEKVYRHLHFQGNFIVKVDEAHSFKIKHYGYEIENSIFWKGIKDGWERVSLSVWIKLVQESSIILDIGANTGIYSLVAKSLNAQANIFAFEPVERVFEKLEFNNQLNNYDINCFSYAVSNSNGNATIFDTPSEHVYSVTVGKNNNPPEVEVIPTTIKTIRLDTFIERLNLPKIDLIKIDVETHEAEVIEGMGKYLEEFKPTMLVEVLNDTVGRNIEDLVQGKGYIYFNLDEQTGRIRRVNHISRSDYYNYLICNEEVAKLFL